MQLAIQGNEFCQVNIWNLRGIWYGQVSGRQSANYSFVHHDVSTTAFRERLLSTSAIYGGRHYLPVYSLLEIWKNNQMMLEAFIQSTQEVIYVPSAE